MLAYLLPWTIPALFWLCAFGLLALRQSNHGSYSWAAAFFLIGAGYAVLLVPPQPPGNPKPLIEDTLFLLGAAAFCRALAERFGQRPSLLVTAAIILLSLAWAAVAIFAWRNVRLETVAVYGGCIALGIAVLLQAHGRARQRQDRILFGAFGATTLLLALQWLDFLVAPAPETWHGSFWEALIRLNGIAVVVLLGGSVFFALALEIVEKWKRIARTDALAGVLNRGGFFEVCEAALARLPRSEVASVVVIDIDRFKSINDRLGHDSGDVVIRTIAGVTAGMVGRDGTVGRTGGDEFAVLLCSPLAAAEDLAERMRERFETIDWPAQLAGLRVTASFGVAQLAVGEPVITALARADRRLYMAKRAGRNQVIGGSNRDMVHELPSALQA